MSNELNLPGVFKGADGLQKLADASKFWEEQPYGTRLYFGDGIADYLHRDVLRAAIEALRTPPAASGQQEVPTQEKLREAIADLLRAAEDCMQMPKPFRSGAHFNEACAELDRVVTAIYAAHPAPAQQESGDDEPVATVSRNSDETLTFTPLRDFYVVNGMPLYTRAPAPAALTDEQIDEIRGFHFSFGKVYGEPVELHYAGKRDIREFARAILATASAAPAELARDAERLDFLISECAIVEEIGGNRYRLHWPDSQEWQQEMHGSAREAIDAAIASQQKGGA